MAQPTGEWDQASGSTLRRAFERWARTGLLRKVHALLVAMLRGDPTLILDSCLVRAKRGGDLTGPNPTDRGYDAESSRALCRSFGAEPHIHTRRQPGGSSLGQQRWPVERSNAWLLENKRLALRYDRLGFIVQALLQTACIFLVAGRLAREL